MGELHLEIIRDRIRLEHKIDVDLGELQVSYHETICDSSEFTHTYDKVVGKNFLDFLKLLIINFGLSFS